MSWKWVALIELGQASCLIAMHVGTFCPWNLSSPSVFIQFKKGHYHKVQLPRGLLWIDQWLSDQIEMSEGRLSAINFCFVFPSQKGSCSNSVIYDDYVL
jgi:hypothetical protein